MKPATQIIYIFWTCKDLLEAKRIVHALLDMKQIACASILPSVQSIYRWEGKIREDSETKVIFKTQKKYFSGVCAYIQKHGSYTVPEICEVAIEQANPLYANWIGEET